MWPGMYISLKELWDTGSFKILQIEIYRFTDVVNIFQTYLM